MTDISLHSMDSVRSNYRRMFLEESRIKTYFVKVPNVAFIRGNANSGSVKSDKSKSGSEYKPSFYS